MSGGIQGSSGGAGGGDPGGRMPRDVKDLLKLCAEVSATNEDEAQGETHTFERMSPERKEWLENALTSMTVDPISRMKECIDKIMEKDKTADDDGDDEEVVLTALEEIIEWAEQIDFAMDFHKIGGFKIFDVCLNHDSPEVRTACLDLIATLVQNNPYCQAAIMEHGLLPKMLHMLDNDEDGSVKTKALYAISCLTRQNELAQKVLTDNDGFSVLMRAMQTDIEKLKIKSAFMLSSFVVDKPQFKDVLCNMGMIDQLVGHLCEEHTMFHEHLMSALLAIVSDHPRSVSECLRPELRIVELLSERKKELHGKEQFREELEYTDRLLEILTSSDGQDVHR